MPEPLHDEALLNTCLERISALSVSAFDGADVGEELQQLVREAVASCRADSARAEGNLAVLVARLRERADAAEREDQPQVRDTFARAVSLAQTTA